MSKNEKPKILLGILFIFLQNHWKKGTIERRYRHKHKIIFFVPMHKLPPGLKIGKQSVRPWKYLEFFKSFYNIYYCGGWSLSCFTIYIIAGVSLLLLFLGSKRKKEKRNEGTEWINWPFSFLEMEPREKPAVVL